MTTKMIAVGDRLPDATLLRIGDQGPQSVSLASLIQGRKVVIFGLPGAYTGTCTTAHVPSFIRTADRFAAKGVEAILCIAVNDPFVLKAWGAETGGTAAGLHFLGDAGADFTRAIGLNFTAPPVGFYDRSRRYALLAEDSVVRILNVEESPGACEISAGETLLGQI
jgi:glutaredoxin/glutathione-dependent peroxiredoxin